MVNLKYYLFIFVHAVLGLQNVNDKSGVDRTLMRRRTAISLEQANLSERNEGLGLSNITVTVHNSTQTDDWHDEAMLGIAITWITFPFVLVCCVWVFIKYKQRNGGYKYLKLDNFF